MPDGLLANLKKSEERRQLVEGLIAKNEVEAIGMTVDEDWPEPWEAAEAHEPRRTRTAPQQVWGDSSSTSSFYRVPTCLATIPFISIPGGPKKPETVIVQNGGFATVYVKVPVGKLTVTFKDNIVESLRPVRGDAGGAGQVSVVAPPLNVFR